MCKKQLNQCRSGDDFYDYAIHHGAENRNGKGSHVIVSTDRGSVVIPRHNNDLGTGLRNQIIKTLIAIGISIIVPGLCLWVLYFAPLPGMAIQVLNYSSYLPMVMR
jgi:hypothetical protein